MTEKTKTAETVKAADDAAIAAAAEPARVEHGGPVLSDDEIGERLALGRRADVLITELLAMDARAREQGHSLTEILVVAAKNQFGIDVRVPDVLAEVA